MNPAQLTKTLNDQADRFAGAALDVEQVVARAGEIRRGRRMRASMAMAAVVVAVAVPIGITVLNGGDGNKASRSPHVATQSPAPNDTSPIRGTGLANGAEPVNGYAYGGVLYRDDKPVALAGVKDPVEIARINGGYLVARQDASGDGSVSFQADEGAGPDITWPYDNSDFRVSPEGNVGAFVQPDGTVIAVQDGGSRYFEVGKLPAGTTYQTDAVVGENCSGRTEETGCIVYAHSNSGDAAVYAVSPHVPAKRVFDGFTRLAGISLNGLVAGMTSATDSGSCWSVDNGSGTQLWRTCANTLISFSPEGDYVLAGSAYQSGSGDSTYTLLDARTGRVVLNLKAAANVFFNGQRWDDPSHVVMNVFDQGTWTIERIGLDGKRSRATSIVGHDSEYVSPFDLG